MQPNVRVLREEVLAFALPAGSLSSFPVKQTSRAGGSLQTISCEKGAHTWHKAEFQEAPVPLNGDSGTGVASAAPPPVAAFLKEVNQALKTSQDAMKPEGKWIYPPALMSLILFGYISCMFLSVIPFATKGDKSELSVYNATANATVIVRGDGKDQVPSWVGVMLVFFMILMMPLIFLLRRGVAEQAKRNVETQHEASRIVDKLVVHSELSDLHVGVYWRSVAFDPSSPPSPATSAATKQYATTLLVIARTEAALADALGPHSKLVLTRVLGKERVLDVVWRPLPMATRWTLFNRLSGHSYNVVPETLGDMPPSTGQHGRFSPSPWTQPPLLTFDTPNTRPLEGRCTDAAMQQIVSDANIVLQDAREVALRNLPLWERQILFQAIGFAIAGFCLLFLVIFCAVGIMASSNRENAALFPLVMIGGGIAFAVGSSLLAWRRKITSKYHNAVFQAAAGKIQALNTGFPGNSEVHHLRVELFREPMQTEDVCLRFIKLGREEGGADIHAPGRRAVV